jgi:hypothetical protein
VLLLNEKRQGEKFFTKEAISKQPILKLAQKTKKPFGIKASRVTASY